MCTSPKFLPVRTVPAVAPKQPQKQTKRVTFHENVRVWPYLHKNDLSEEEIANSWYNEQDNARIRAECAQTIQLHNQGKIHNDSVVWCFRGLEFRTSEGAARRRENKYLAWDTVLNEQDSQFVLGEFDDEIIACRYLAVSALSQDEALAHAAEDAKAAAEHQNISRIALAVSNRATQANMFSSKGAVLAARPRKILFNVTIPVRQGSISAAA